MLDTLSFAPTTLFGFPIKRIQSLELQIMDLTVAFSASASTVFLGCLYPSQTLANFVGNSPNISSSRVADLSPMSAVE